MAVTGRRRITSRAEVEHVAFDLFERQGFEQTTVDDIASAVGIGRRTFFRYFGSKNDVPWGDFDGELARMRRRLAATPPVAPLMDAIRQAIVDFNRMPPEQVPAHRRRMTLILGVPALQAHSTLRFAAWRQVIADFVAERTGLRADALLPHTVGHAMLGVAVAAYEQWLANPGDDLCELLDSAIRALGSAFASSGEYQEWLRLYARTGTSSTGEDEAMKTKAAVLYGTHEKWQIEEMELDPPKAKEVLVKLTASGLCHSDEHLVTGDIPMPLPVVGGHEGAGKVVEAGPGVDHVKEGDSVVLSFLPACGRCSYCARGMQNLCDLGMFLINGPQLDGTYRFHSKGKDIGQMCLLGTFSEYTVVPAQSVVKVDDGTSLDKAALVGCGVTTGFGSAVRTAETKAGDTVVVMGIGGIGINAVQGARIAGARYIVAIDPVEFKRTKALELGVTHAAASVEEAVPIVGLLTRGQMAESFIITTDVAEGDYVGPALDMVAKRGKVVVTAVGHPADTQMSGSIWMLTMMEKQVRGSLYGSSNAQHDIPRMLEMYNNGQLKLDELITREYPLEEVNQGYEDMRNGLNIRGLIRY